MDVGHEQRTVPSPPTGGPKATKDTDDNGAEAKPTATVGDALPEGAKIATVEEILERAPSDLKTQFVHVEEWDVGDEADVWVKIRTLTANERARIRQVGMGRIDSDVAWAEMEIQQFLKAVVDPQFNEHQVRKLHNSSGPGFAAVIAAHDDLSAMSKEELADARREFREQE